MTLMFLFNKRGTSWKRRKNEGDGTKNNDNGDVGEGRPIANLFVTLSRHSSVKPACSFDLPRS